MHEVSLCRSIVHLCESLAREQKAAKICHVVLEIGAMAPVDTEALRFAFDVVSRNSMADGASLDILEVGGIGRCRRCGLRSPMAQRFSACPYCGDVPMDVERGDEMRLQCIEVL